MRVDDHLQGRHRGAAHLAQRPQHAQPAQVRLVVLRAARADHLAGRQQSLAQVVLHRGQRHVRTVGQLGDQHGSHSIHGKICENPAKSVVQGG